MQYINSKLENIDVTILPLLIHWEDINLDHLSYMADKADPYHSVVQDMQAAIQPELHKLNLISGMHSFSLLLSMSEPWCVTYRLVSHHAL
jgi:hypothetical protein